MKATINGPAGVEVFSDWLAENKWMPPGVQTWGFVENLAGFLQGDTAMTVSWPPYGRWAAGYGTDQEALSWVPKSQVAGKVGYAMPPGGHPQLAAGFALSVAAGSKKKDAAYLFIQWLNSEEISLERVQLPYALRDPFRDSHFAERRVQGALAGGAAISGGAAGRCGQRAARPLADPDRQVRGGDPPGRLAPVGRRGPADHPRTTSPPNGTPSPSASASTSSAPPTRRGPPSPTPTRRPREPQPRRPPSPAGACRWLADRQFKYLAITPAVLVILLIGLFPLIYTAMVSFQNINMLEEDTSFSGLLNYARLLHDARFWQALGHTFLFLAIALPVELVLGLLLAFLFLDRMPGRQVFVALLVLPVVISPIIAGATWRLLFDNRFGPINQIIGWIAGRGHDDPLDRQPELRLPGDPHRRDLAVDAVHVPAAAGRPLATSTDRSSRPPRSTAPASSSPSARSSCRRSGPCSRSPC